MTKEKQNNDTTPQLLYVLHKPGSAGAGGVPPLSICVIARSDYLSEILVFSHFRCLSGEEKGCSAGKDRIDLSAAANNKFL